MPRPRTALLLVLVLAVLAPGSWLLARAAMRPVGPAFSTRLGTWHGELTRLGKRVQPVGVNAFGATTWYSTNWGCGSPVTDLDAMFTALPQGSIVRTWAFQALGWNNKQSPQHLDFFALDRVVAAATRHHQLLDLVLSDQAGTCDDGHWHDQAWYDGGYTQRHPDDGRGLGDLSYAQWVDQVVARYRTSTAVAIWEPVNEPEASDCSGAVGSGCEDPSHRTCPAGATASLTRFFTAIGTRIHVLDPHALVSTGTLGGGECGIAGDGFATVAASPGVDITSYHDYGSAGTALPAGLRERLQQSRKPLLVGEAGITGCPSLPRRAADVRAKVRAARAAGVGGWLAWWYSESPSSCGQDFGPHDPLLAALRQG